MNESQKSNPPIKHALHVSVFARQIDMYSYKNSMNNKPTSATKIFVANGIVMSLTVNSLVTRHSEND